MTGRMRLRLWHSRVSSSTGGHRLRSGRYPRRKGAQHPSQPNTRPSLARCCRIQPPSLRLLRRALPDLAPERTRFPRPLCDDPPTTASCMRRTGCPQVSSEATGSAPLFAITFLQCSVQACEASPPIFITALTGRGRNLTHQPRQPGRAPNPKVRMPLAPRPAFARNTSRTGAKSSLEKLVRAMVPRSLGGGANGQRRRIDAIKSPSQTDSRRNGSAANICA